ncbi:MAG: hypothetical protein WD032_11980 [Nitrospirales bacterium]
MDVYPTDMVKVLADGLTLVYHEARNVRHLVKAEHMPAIGWEHFSSLPKNRVEAWRAFQDVRKTAAVEQTADKAVKLFEKKFAKSLANLEDLYANPHWKHAGAFGGHAWCSVTTAVTSLRDAIERGEVGEIESATQSLLKTRHNNGAVRDKIAELDREIGVQTGRWWR